MIPEIVKAEYIKEYKIRLRFLDGTEGEVDLENELYGEIFEPLKDIDIFKSFEVHPEFHTLCWPNGADFAPEFLHNALQVLA